MYPFPTGGSTERKFYVPRGYRTLTHYYNIYWRCTRQMDSRKTRGNLKFARKQFFFISNKNNILPIFTADFFPLHYCSYQVFCSSRWMLIILSHIQQTLVLLFLFLFYIRKVYFFFKGLVPPSYVRAKKKLFARTFPIRGEVIYDKATPCYLISL